MEHVRSTSPAGRLLEHTLKLDRDTKRYSVRWDEVTVEEAMALDILEDERGKWEREESERRAEEAEQERRMGPRRPH